MKKIIVTPHRGPIGPRFPSVLLAVIVFAVLGCGNDTDSEQTYNEQTHYGTGTLNITGEQVWVRNYSTNRISQAYEQFSERDYNIIVLGEIDKKTSGYSEEIGSGTINGGKISFSVDVPDDLLDWDELKVFFTVIVEGEGWDVEIDESETKGTFILLMTDEEPYLLTKEGLSGTNSSLSDETVFFVYVDSDCTITGESKEDQQVMYTFNPFTLKLEKGWNTVWYKQTYTTSGRSSFFMDIKNPDLKWVLIPMVPTM